MSEDDDSEPSRRLCDMQCPECHARFRLRWEDDYGGPTDDTGRKLEPTTLCLSGCDSGGIYGVRIVCPACGYKEEV